MFLTQSVGNTSPPIVDKTAELLADANSKTSAPDKMPISASTSDDVVPFAVTSSEPGDSAAEQLPSSSTTDSDLDSDSDSDSKSDSEDEGEKSKEKTQTMTNDDKKIPPEPEATPATAAEAVQGAAPAAVITTTGAAPATVKATNVGSEELVDSTLEMCTITDDTPKDTATSTKVKVAPEVIEDTEFPAVPDTHVITLAENVTEGSSSEKAQTSAAVGTTQHASAASHPAEEPVVAKAEVSAPVNPEELVGHTPVVAEVAGEELQTEAPAELSEEVAAVVPPQPEEPFDNSTYKNYQHHRYTHYTFVDLAIEMANFRLPQPSSGRPSPRH
ncbi:flocculation protein FLO11 isoform X1 [Mastacembelus armatus]|nr:NADH dehydrogenase [ubiquinone] flavoprotein 3, mitochondrial isoform X1 [Mastacembelus armatus]